MEYSNSDDVYLCMYHCPPPPLRRAYAQVFQGFVRDSASGKTKLNLDITEPLYIIELGAGSGKFSFFMLKALVEMKEVLDFPLDKVVLRK